MATDMFLILDGIQGESRDAQYPKSIDIGSVTYGMSASGSWTDPYSGKPPSVDQIVVSKLVDSASLLLLRALAETSRVSRGRILIRTAGTTTKPVLLLAIDLEGVYVRGVEAENRSADERPSERVTLTFENIVWTYTPVTPTGTPGTPISYKYTVSAPMA
jgi:type VI secretion system secreted protein Hcp